MLSGRVPPGHLAPRAPIAHAVFVEADAVIARAEAVAMMFAVLDILSEVRAIRQYLEDDDDGELEEGLGD